MFTGSTVAFFAPGWEDDPHPTFKSDEIRIYDIEIPDYAHRGGANYPEAKRAKTWFKIGHNGERYLHAGGHSLGCMTVIEVTRWMEIYNALIKARKGDFMSVGVLEVIK